MRDTPPWAKRPRKAQALKIPPFKRAKIATAPLSARSWLLRRYRPCR